LDLYFHGAALELNVPASMCSYIKVMPYYYYKKESGDGPTTGHVWIPDAAAVPPAGSDTKCVYDYSSTGGTDGNCCTGTYTKITHTWDATAVAWSTANSDASWGGSKFECLSGPAKETQKPSGVDGIYLPTVTYIEGQGMNHVYPIQAPYFKGLSSNVYVSNFYYASQHSGSAPTAIVQPYYEYQCLDRSEEVQARIRILIREWNLNSEWALGATGNPDTTGNESSPFTFLPKNDYKDWLDFQLSSVTYPGGAE
jgi:hypothetical protein